MENSRRDRVTVMEGTRPPGQQPAEERDITKGPGYRFPTLELREKATLKVYLEYK